jgi:hypothetical protein
MGLWLGLHPAAGLLPAAALGVALVVLEVPIGPPERLTGTVERVEYVVRRSSARTISSVRLADGSRVRLRVYGGSACAAGDVIGLQRQRRLLGYAYVADARPCTRASAAALR